MKNILILIFVTFHLAVIAQTGESVYNVIQINGNIFNVTQSTNLVQGNAFEGQDKLNFKKNSYAYVVSDMHKKYMLRTPSIESQDADIFSNAQLALSPIRSRGQLSTRGAVSTTGVKDFKTYLGIDNFNVIGPLLEIPMDSNRYPLNDKQFIVFYYEINNHKVSKKVGFNNQVLRIEEDKLKASKGEVLTQDTIKDLSVYQYNPSTGESNLITEINLCFIDPFKLKSEMETLIPVLQKQNMSKPDIIEYLKQYVIDIYGNLDENQLNAFVSTIDVP